METREGGKALLLKKKQKEEESFEFPEEYIFAKPKMRKYHLNKEGIRLFYKR